jgi:RNA polymerase sigma-70 factor (ECF subfamily)
VTWLWRIAIHLAADHRRNRRTAFWRRLFSVAPADGSARDERMQAVAAANPSPERAAIARQEAALAWAAADRLPSQQRTIFLLRFAEEMSLDEIAVALGLEVGTVKAHLHRAVVAVRKALRPGETP